MSGIVPVHPAANPGADAEGLLRAVHKGDGRIPEPSHRTVDILRRLDGSRRFTEALLAQIHSGVIAADGKGRITFANRSALETLGADIVQCVGRDLVATFGGSPELERALFQVVEGGETRADVTIRTEAGSRLDLGMTVMRTTDMAPPDMAFVLLFRDVSDRRQFEMELRRVERISAMGNMVAGFAHEIRNPLAGIQALAEALLLDLPGDDQRREYPERMLALLTRVEQFVNATLRFGEPKPARHSRQEAGSIVRGAAETLSARWGRRGSPPAISVAPSLPSLHCDEAQITEALLALIENAIDAAGDAARVRISVRAQPAHGLLNDVERLIRFDVVDDGPGVPEALMARIFDPFFTTKANGTGLGLALAQNLVRENGGRLLVTSTPGVGSVFSILLPEADS